jgi:outer membrane protein assembly factor BamB
MTGVAGQALKPPFARAWKFQAAAPVKATACLSGGNVYIGDGDGVFHCLALESGDPRWSFTTEGPIEGSACAADGLVVFGSGDGFVYALDAAGGGLKWKFETDGEVLGGATAFQAADGAWRFVIGSYDYSVYCFDSAGNKLWSYETTNYVNGAPTVADGKVYFGGCDGFVYTLDAETGKEAGKVEVSSYISNSAAVRDGVAYVGHYGNACVAVDAAAGKVLWSFSERGFGFFAAPAVGDDFVLAGSRDKRLYRLDRTTGEKVWEFKTGGIVDSSPVVAGDTVLVGSEDGFVYALGLGDGAEKWSYEIGEAVISSPAVASGFVVIGADDGGVYAFREAPAAAEAP